MKKHVHTLAFEDKYMYTQHVKDDLSLQFCLFYVTSFVPTGRKSTITVLMADALFHDTANLEKLSDKQYQAFLCHGTWQQKPLPGLRGAFACLFL